MGLKTDLPRLFDIGSYASVHSPDINTVNAAWIDGDKALNLRFRRVMSEWDTEIEIAAQNPADPAGEWAVVWYWTPDDDARNLWSALADKAWREKSCRHHAWQSAALAALGAKEA